MRATTLPTFRGGENARRWDHPTRDERIIRTPEKQMRAPISAQKQAQQQMQQRPQQQGQQQAQPQYNYNAPLPQYRTGWYGG